MDSYTLNKYAGGFIAAVLVVFLLGKIGNIAVHPTKLKKQVYSDVALVKDQGSKVSEDKKDEPPLPILLANASLDKGMKVAKKCASCHTFNKDGANKVGPNLYNVLGAPMAKVSGFAYSSALKKFGGEWGYEELNLFLKNPKSYISGTKMAFAGLKKPTDRASIILYMRSSVDNPPPLPPVE